MVFMAVFCFFAQLNYESKNIFPLGSVVDLFFRCGGKRLLSVCSGRISRWNGGGGSEFLFLLRVDRACGT